MPDRHCARCKQDLPEKAFGKGRWCTDCQTTYFQDHQDVILDYHHRLVQAGATEAESEGRCAWSSGDCPKPATHDRYCRTHAFMQSVRDRSDYRPTLRAQGFKL